jgi:hypothetical protein
MDSEELLERYIQERDMLEMELEVENDLMKSIEAEKDLYESDYEWNKAWNCHIAIENELQSLENAIAELQDTDE